MSDNLHSTVWASTLEKHLGLELRLKYKTKPTKDGDARFTYEVLSPTGVVLFEVGGWYSHSQIGCVSTPQLLNFPEL